MRIYFTQCSVWWKFSRMKELSLLPIIQRCQEYEEMLTKAHPESCFYTLDEHFILIAQWLRRTGVIKELTVVSQCACNGTVRITEIPIDDQGDFTEDCPHGFFPQRLKYLR